MRSRFAPEIPVLYVPPSFSTDPNASYAGKNVAAGKQGSKVPPGALEYPQREIMAVIAAANLAGTNTDLTQLLQAINILAAAKTTTALGTKTIVGGRVLFAQAVAGTYTFTPDVPLIYVRAVAGGGGGGGGNGYAGAGGLGANYFEGAFDVVVGQPYTIVVGAGGIAGGGSGGGAPGGNGGATYLARQGGATLALALGGTGGGSGGNAATGYVGVAGASPGKTGIVFPHGGFELLGFGAQNGVYYAAGATNIAQGGMGGGAPMFASATPFPVQTGQFGGTGCGGGGSGGAGSALGAAGAPGFLTIMG